MPCIRSRTSLRTWRSSSSRESRPSSRMRPRLRRRQVRNARYDLHCAGARRCGCGEPRPQHRGRAEFVVRNRPAAPGRRGAHRRGRLRRSWEGALPVHREGRPFARRPEGRRRCMPPPAMPFRRSLRSPASAAPAFSAINGASPPLLPPWGSPFYLQGGLRSAAQRGRRIARTLSSRRNGGRDHADRAGRSCGVRSVQLCARAASEMRSLSKSASVGPGPLR